MMNYVLDFSQPEMEKYFEWIVINFIVSSALKTSDINYNKEEETVTISFPSPLPLGNGQLFIDFTGELNDKMKGFYRSKYTGTDGNEKYCAVTQFEVSELRMYLQIIFLEFIANTFCIFWNKSWIQSQLNGWDTVHVCISKHHYLLHARFMNKYNSWY